MRWTDFRARGEIPVLGAALFMLGGCSSAGDGRSAILYGQACKPFDPAVTNSCMISSERRSEITELPEPPGMYRYCAWPALLSGKYRTQYRDVDGSIHDFTPTPVLTAEFSAGGVPGVRQFRDDGNGPLPHDTLFPSLSGRSALKRKPEPGENVSARFRPVMRRAGAAREKPISLRRPGMRRQSIPAD